METVFLASTTDAAFQVALAVAIAAFLGAAGATLLRLPKVAGYLVVGALFGPAGFDVIDDPADTEVAAEIGVALLLFVVGLELSVRELVANLRVGLVLGLGGTIAAAMAMAAAAPLLGLSGPTAFVLGGAAGLSSTATALVLLQRLGGEGRALAAPLVAVLIVQDVLAAVLIAVVPSISDGSEATAAVAQVAVAAAAAIVVLPLLALLLAGALVRIAAVVDRELFLIAVVALIGAAAVASALAGVSPALGAFLAGLVVSQAGYSQQALRETTALRDVFAAAFFVSAGLLFDPDVVTDDPGLLGAVLVAAVVAKGGAFVVLGRLLGLPWRVVLPLALLLANIGEFSFVVAQSAGTGVLDEGGLSTVVLCVVVSLLITALGVRVAEPRAGKQAEELERARVAVIGYGRIGRLASRELQRRGIPLLVVERDVDLAGLARADGYVAIWGDATLAGVMKRIGRGKLYLVTPEGQGAAEMVSRLATLAPGSRVVTPAAPEEEVSRLGLDLTVVDADGPISATLGEAVERALATRVEPFTVRSAAGVVRYPPGRQAAPLGVVSRVFRAWARAPAGGGPGGCPACGGRGRRYAGVMFVTCSVCGGDGQR